MKAKITASRQQLELIGINENITNIEVKVSNLDKWNGIYAPCSTVDFDHPQLKKCGIIHKCNYIIPTRWLDFT